MKNLRVKEVFLIAMLLLVIVINSVDFIKDIREGDDWLHILIEIITVCLSLWGIYWLIQSINRRARENSSLQSKIIKTEQKLELSRSKFKKIGREYSKYIHEQFNAWQLTASEKEVAFLLLKGLSFKEIAAIRNTKEKSVRQQASAIYGKSNISGRHEFAAWFFEDMLG